MRERERERERERVREGERVRWDMFTADAWQVWWNRYIYSIKRENEREREKDR